MRGLRPIAQASVGAWKRHLGRTRGQQAPRGALTPLLIECGYEPPADWERCLDGVEPDLSRSRYPEHVYFWSRISRRINALRKAAMYKRRRRSAQNS